MGYYIEVDQLKDKANRLKELYPGLVNDFDGATYQDTPVDKTLLCVVENPNFDAIAIISDEYQFKMYLSPDDYRPKKWLTIDKQKAAELCPSAAEQGEL